MTAYRVTGPTPDASPVQGRRPVGAKVLLVLGLLMVAGAVVGFRSGTHRVVDGGRKLQERADRLRRDLVVELDVPGRTTVRLRPGRYNIYDLDILTNLGGSTTAPGASGGPSEPTATTGPTASTDPNGAAGSTATSGPGGASDPTVTGPADPAVPPSTPPVVTDRPTGPDGRPLPGDPDATGTPGSTTTPGTIDLGPRNAVVTITGPDGVEVEQTSPSLTSLADAVGGKLLVQQQVRIERNGTYTVEATGIDGGKIGIGKVESTGEVGRVVSGAFLTIAAIVLGGMGAVAAVAGLIWLLAGGRSTPPPGSGPMPGWTPAGPAGFGPTTTSWSPGSDPTGRPPLPPPPPPPGPSGAGPGSSWRPDPPAS